MVPSTGFEPVSRRLQRHVLTTITTMAMAREERFERSVTGLEPIGLPLNRFSRGPGSQTRTEKKPLLRRADLPIFLIPDGVASGIRAHVSEFTTQSLRLLDHSHNFPQLGFEPRFAPSKGAVLPVRRPRSISAQMLTAQNSSVRIASTQGSIAPILLVQYISVLPGLEPGTNRLTVGRSAN